MSVVRTCKPARPRAHAASTTDYPFRRHCETPFPESVSVCTKIKQSIAPDRSSLTPRRRICQGSRQKDKPKSRYTGRCYIVLSEVTLHPFHHMQLARRNDNSKLRILFGRRERRSRLCPPEQVAAASSEGAAGMLDLGPPFEECTGGRSGDKLDLFTESCTHSLLSMIWGTVRLSGIKDCFSTLTNTNRPGAGPGLPVWDFHPTIPQI